jgi:hypothetical protein
MAASKRTGTGASRKTAKKAAQQRISLKIPKVSDKATFKPHTFVNLKELDVDGLADLLKKASRAKVGFVILNAPFRVRSSSAS